MYNRMFDEEFLDAVHVLYAECELEGLEEDEQEYPYSIWLYDLYEMIIEHKEELKR